MSEQELYDIQKFSNSGLLNEEELNNNLDDRASLISKSATALLMETNYTNRDEMISSITRSKQ